MLFHANYGNGLIEGVTKTNKDEESKNDNSAVHGVHAK